MTCSNTDGAKKSRRWCFNRPTWPDLKAPIRRKSTYSTRLPCVIVSHMIELETKLTPFPRDSKFWQVNVSGSFRGWKNRILVYFRWLPWMCLSQLCGTHSNPTCILLTLWAHLNLSLKAHYSLQLTAAWNSTVQSHPALLIHSLSATWALCKYKLYIVLYCTLCLKKSSHL